MKKTALVYDWLDTKHGGAERVIKVFLQLYPEADIYSSFGEEEILKAWDRSSSRKIKFSFLQYFPKFFKKNKKWLLPFLPIAFLSFDFSEYDQIISMTSAYAKCIRTKKSSKHICYLLTPPRYVWEYNIDYPNYDLRRWFITFLIIILKKLDQYSANRCSEIITISHFVKNRVKNYYNLDSKVIYPPFDSNYWRELSNKSKKMNEDFYLIVSRLVSYKKIDLVVRAFNELGKNLVIIGAGTELANLQKIAKNNIKFIQNVNDDELASYYTHAKALIMPQIEEFGYTSLEAQACGCPVITFSESGTAETIIEGKTGLVFPSQSIESLVKIVQKCDIIYTKLKQSTSTENVDWLQKFEVATFIKNWQLTVKN